MMNVSNVSSSQQVEGGEVSLWYTFIAYWELMVCVVGTPLNLLVIFIWFSLSASRSPNRRSHSQSRNQYFILSQTTSDLLFASIHAPLMYCWYDVASFEMTDTLCYFMYGITHLSTTVSSISLLLLNIDKFIYLHWPLHYHSMITKKRALAMAICGWSIGLIWANLFLFSGLNEIRDNCEIKPKQKITYAAFLVIFFLMPIILSTITSCYIAMVAVKARIAEAKATHMALNINMPPPTPIAAVVAAEEEHVSFLRRLPMSRKRTRASAGSVRSDLATVVPWRTITFVFTTTIWSTLTYLPYRISFFISIIYGSMDANWQLSLFALMVVYCAINPIFTIATQPSYRRRVVEIFKSLQNKKAST